MPSPKIRQRQSIASLSNPNAGTALRRGDLKISDPIPFDTGLTGYPPSTTNGMTALTSAKQQDGIRPRKTSPPELQHAKTTSISHAERYDIGRASAGPSLVPSSLSTGPSKNSLSQRKSSGFRATLKRMFSSKKARSSFDQHRATFHQSVSHFQFLSNLQLAVIGTYVQMLILHCRTPEI